MASPGRPPGQPKTGGRKRGSLDKEQRRVLTDQMAFDVWETYNRLGPDWLFELAQQRPDLFLSQCLSRLLPPPQRDGDPDVVLQQLNVGSLSDFESARRIAFALSKAAQQMQEEQPTEAKRIPDDPDLPPLDTVKVSMPTSEPGPEPESLAEYRGTRAEHGSPSRQDLYGKKPSR